MTLYNRGILKDFSSSPATELKMGKMALAGEVLVQSDETSELDPLLFAVPVPILTSSTGNPPTKKSSGSKERPKTPPPPPLALEHHFSTAAELRAIGDEKRVRKHLFRVFSKLSAKGWRRSLLTDFNLLLCLGDHIDEPSLASLCASLKVKETEDVPKEVAFALDVMKQSLEEIEDDEDEL